jgi:hypothetical protein
MKEITLGNTTVTQTATEIKLKVKDKEIDKMVSLNGEADIRKLENLTPIGKTMDMDLYK